MSTLKGKNLLPLGSRFFPFRVDPFSEERRNQFDKVPASMGQLDVCPTGDQEVVCPDSAGSATFFRGD